MQIVIVITIIVIVLVGFIWLGLRVRPRPFAPYLGRPAELPKVPLPDGLPAPVERYYRQLYGNEVPVITSAVVSGRASIKPFGQEEQQFVVRFDPESGRQTMMEAMRYRDETTDKILWLARAVPGPTIEAGGAVLDATGSATWLDQGAPWATFTAEEIVYNADVDDYIRTVGP